ncbi:hypothetical protein IKN40_02115 [bacterium]|nr:hypothetical protein [bacterium]
MSNSKEKLPGILRTRKKYSSWQHIAVEKLDELLKEEFEVLWAYIHGVKNPLSNEDYLFFECKFLSCCTSIEKIIFYFTHKQKYKSFTTDETLLYKAKQILALLEILHNIYEHRKYQQGLENPFQTGMYIKSILDIILSMLTELLHSDENHVLIRDTKEE